MRRALPAIVILCVALGAGVLLLREAGRPQAQGARGCSRVVLVVIDTLRADHLSSYGYPKETAPLLRRLADRGVLFESAHATSGWTAPATASIFTSLYPFQHQVLTGLAASTKRRIAVNRIPDELETVAEAFQKNGYETFAVTANLNVAPVEGFDQGFGHFHNFARGAASEVNAIVEQWAPELRRAARSFLYLHYMDPHGPYLQHEPWFQPSGNADEDAIRAYDSEIHFVDQHIAALSGMLGWEEDALVVLTADHGEEFGDHGHTGHGRTLYRELTEIPLIFHDRARWPRPGRIAGRVSAIDILPTLADLCSLETEGLHQGRSLVPAIDGSTLPGADERALYAHLYRATKDPPLLIRSLIQDDWKLLLYNSGDRELYDLRSDPRETTNHASRHPEKAAALEAALLALESDAKTYPAQQQEVLLDREEQERLRVLGYVQ